MHILRFTSLKRVRIISDHHKTRKYINFTITSKVRKRNKKVITLETKIRSVVLIFLDILKQPDKHNVQPLELTDVSENRGDCA